MPFAIAAASALAIAVAQEPSGAPIEGRWINPAKSVIIAIAPCGDAQCGTVEWASAEAQADARKGTENLIGTALLTDLKPNGPDQWQGELFIPDRKMRVTAKIQHDGEGRLKVTGCALGGLICDSQIWSMSDGAPATE